MTKKMTDLIVLRTKEIFKTMFLLNLVDEAPRIIVPKNENIWDISGVISITGAMDGLIAMRYPRSLVELMLKNALAQRGFPEMNSTLMGDMVGEVANIITGNVISDVGMEEMYLSIPITIQGENHRISWPRDTDIIGIPFKCDAGEFVIQIGLN